MADRLIVCGGRNWSDRAWLEHRLGYHINAKTVVVHGGCSSGADRMARDFCNKVDARQEIHEADWSKGHEAGPQRNRRMAELGADLCLAFWDGKSRGTMNMIQWAVKFGIPVQIVPAQERR